jgi:hypothetical protein
VARVRASHSYGLVLALIVASFLFAAAASDAAWTGSVLVILMSVTLVTALWTSGLARANSPVNFVLVAIATAVAVANLVQTGPSLAAAVGLLAGLLTITTATVVALGVIDQREANTRSVLGAICVYVLIGMMFVFVYGVVAVLGSGPFFAQGTDGTRAVRLYFSFVTLATVGYGDYTAAGNFGHTLAIIEALVGQLYLVTVVAVLVSRLGVRRR